MSLAEAPPPRPARWSPARAVVSLPRVDARYWVAIPPQDRTLAERAVTAARVDLHDGPWEPEDLRRDDRHAVGVLVLSGAVRRDVVLGGRISSQLMGAGDVIRPWPASMASLDTEVRWSAHGLTSLAVLGRTFKLAARRWPGLSDVLHHALDDQLEAAARQIALTGLPRVEDRVLGMFWHLADRWGTVRSDGIVVRLPLTHALIGQLIGARRPTVSLALAALAADGLLRREDQERWVLSHASAEALRDLT
jgi:CRP/FNR family transcriptional regulator, cyclic AMP receptor protein